MSKINKKMRCGGIKKGIKKETGAAAPFAPYEIHLQQPEVVKG